MNHPNVQTHVAAVSTAIPEHEPQEEFERPDLPVPSLWQRSVIAVNRRTGKKVVVHRVDHAMNLFRAYYPDELDPKTKALGRFGAKTEWFSCAPGSEWEPEVTWSPDEMKRQEAQKALDAALEKLDAKSLSVVQVLCDDPDPAKNYAKMQAMITAGIIKVDLPAEAVVEAPKGKK